MTALDRTFFAEPEELHYRDCIRSPYLEKYRYRAKARLHVPTDTASLRYRLSALWRSDLKRRIRLADRYAAIYRAGPYDHTAYLSYVGLGKTGASLIGDITPSYALLDRETYAEMLGCAADVRFVFILRDPVERLWSGLKQHYRSATRTGQLDSADLIARFDSICRTPLDINFLRSDYRRTIQELEAAVPAARISYCFFETLLDPAQGQDARADLARFLDIPASALNAEQKVHATASTVPLPADSRSAARRALDPVYVALAEKFGDRIPTVWQM